MIQAACKGWKKYQGRFAPQCSNGWGCEKCWHIYNSRRYAKKREFQQLWDEFFDPDCQPPVDFEDSELREAALEEMCWQFFIRGLELSLGPPPKV